MSNAAIRAAVAEQELFRGLDPEFVEALSAHAVEREFADNELVFRQGAPAETFYLVGDGLIVIEIPAIEGPPLELQRLGRGELLGWSWLIPPYRWNFQARAEGSTRVLVFDGRAIRARCEQDPRLGYAVFKRFAQLMSERLEEARAKMIEQWRPEGFG